MPYIDDAVMYRSDADDMLEVLIAHIICQQCLIVRFHLPFYWHNRQTVVAPLNSGQPLTLLLYAQSLRSGSRQSTLVDKASKRHQLICLCATALSNSQASENKAKSKNVHHKLSSASKPNVNVSSHRLAVIILCQHHHPSHHSGHLNPSQPCHQKYAGILMHQKFLTETR